MAHHVEPMDVDNSICDFDNKENSLHHNNVLAKGTCMEKGYEELEVSELNMKLRYSITPTSSPMSKSFTANCLDNKQFEAGDNNITNTENANLTRSMNSTITRSDSIKKVLPLQSLPTDQFIDGNRNLRTLEPTVFPEKDVTITVSGPNDLDEHLFIPSSSSSSLAHTPEATTPTKECNKHDGGSPIMRGLKSVLSMFRSSQSPIPTTEDDNAIKPEVLSPPVINSPNTSDSTPSTMLVSTPLAAQKTALSKREAVSRDSIVFKDDLENELEWKDESTIIFSTEKIPIHKLFMTQNKPVASKSSSNVANEVKECEADEKLDSTVEYMDISYNDLITNEKTVTGPNEIINQNDITNVTESDSEFLDCETTFPRNDNKNVSLDSKQDNEIKEDPNEGLNTTVTNESLNDTLSKAHDSLTLSTESTKVLVSMEKDVTPVAQEQVDSAKEEITDNETCKPTASLCQPGAEYPLAVKFTEQVSPSCDLELDIGNNIYSNPNGINNVIDTITSRIDSEKLSENIVVSSLSQIPLIADPRVLLFNIPDETSKILSMQNKEDLNSTPADIPLPDDEDLEKVEVNEETGTDKQVSIDDNLKVPLYEQKPIDETLFTKLFEIVSSSEEIPINDVVENKLDEEHEQIKVTEAMQFEQEGENENKVVIADISNTNTMESLTELDQLEYKDNTLKQHVVDEVASILAVKVIPSHNSMYSETRNDNSSTIVKDEHIDVNCESLSLKKTKEISTSISDSEHLRDFIQNETNNVIESEFIVIKAVEITSPKLERVLDEKISSLTHAEKENLVKEQNVKELHSTTEGMDNVKETHSTTEGMDILNSSLGSKETTNLYNTAATKETTEIDNNSFKEDTGMEVSSTAIVAILGKEIQQEKGTCEDNVTATEIRQELVKFEDKVSDGENIYEILASTPSPILISMEQDETPAPRSNEVLPAEPISITVDTHVEEEIVASKDNSPFIAISANNLEGSPKSQEYDNFEDVDNPRTKNDIDQSPPLSPKIVSKGYNLNFDEIEDPFATKTKTRLSPSRDGSPNELFENIEINVGKPKSNMIQNRRKSQPARKRPANTKKMNSTFSGSCKTSIDQQESDQPKVIPKETKTMSTESSKPNEIPIKNYEGEEKPKFDNLPYGALETLETRKDATKPVNKTQDPEVLNEDKNTSSSELSTYQSAEASLYEGRDSKNVFNLPEIDDANFNSFLTKSNVRQSPVPSQKTDDPFETANKIRSSPVPKDNSLLSQLNESGSEKAIIKDHNETATFENKCSVLEEQNSSNDASNTTCSSKATDDKDTTVREVHTEDEDTIEGPFLDTGLNHDDKVSDFGGKNLDMMEFSELPTQESESQEAGELFIDAEAFEFLLNQNKANEVADSGKESLFLKFDPLYAKRMSSDGVVAALNRMQKKKQSTPKKIAEFPLNDVTFDKSPVPGPSTMNVTPEMETDNIAGDSIEDLNITVTKPMMVVNPAVNPIPAPRNKAITPVRSNRQSLTFTSPAIAVIDRLLSMSANNSLIGHEVSVTEVRGHSEADLALTQLRELLADKEISVYNLKSESKELKERLSTLESQMKNLEALSEERLKKINNLTEKLAEKTNLNKSMAAVVEEYERTIASLIAETEQDRKRHTEERLQLINERDEQTRHLASMEVSFSDLHSKYEKSKQVIFGFKANEDSLKKSIKDFEENLAKMQTNYELLKQHATSKLNHANEELQKMNRAHETEVLKLNAMIKRQELHITSLEETLLQKTKANEELTAICDELINRVG